MPGRKPHNDGMPLRRGWTTGACATAAATAAYSALLDGCFPDPVCIRLPRGETPCFTLAREARPSDAVASAAIVKDAGDDPDVTHGALVEAEVRVRAAGASIDAAGIRFFAGRGVGTVTRAGLPLPPGEPAINPTPRRMLRDNLEAVAQARGLPAPDLDVTIGIEGGEALARQTWNPRLGIVGGLSVLGTTGIVVPYSCAAWIHSIHRGIDVARAAGLAHVAASTGSTSERVVRATFDLPDVALLDMGDFAGGLLKYLRRHPLPRLTLAGGFAKLVKLGRGHLDLHSGRSTVDFEWLAARASEAGCDAASCERIAASNTALEALGHAGTFRERLAHRVAECARATALGVLRGAAVEVGVLVVARDGRVLARI